MKRFCVFFAACIVFVFPANADDIIHGEKGDWNAHWLGLGADDASKFSRAGSIIAQAIEAAKDDNKYLFYSFWNVDSNNPPAQLKICYNEWNSISQRYVYLIVQEAFSSNDDQYCAISIVPAATRQKSPTGTIANETQIRAQVIFASRQSGIWKLLPDDLDRQIEQELLSRASVFINQPNQNSTAAGLAEQDRKFHSDFLELMRKNGATPESIASQKETYQVEESGVHLNHWTDWTNYFKTVILNPPVIFENRDAYSYNFGDPISAFRSYSRAMWVGDGKTLFKYADKSGQANLTNLGVDTNSVVGTYDLPIMTHTTVLLVAATIFQGKNYVLVFWRAQNETNPQSGSIALQSTIFVHQDDEYLLTSDLDDSVFGDILGAAHASGGVWKYPNFEKTLKQSEFPTIFYDIR